MGKEAVLLYLNDEYGSVSRPVKQLKGFKKISLNPGESSDVEFELTINDLMFINKYNKKVYEEGYFNIYVGTEKARFVLKDSKQTSKPFSPTTSVSRMTSKSSSTTTTTPNSSSLLYQNLSLTVFSVFLQLIIILL